MKPNIKKPEHPKCKTSGTQEPITIVVNLLKLQKKVEILSKKLEDARVLVNVQRSKGCTQDYKECCFERLIKLLNDE